MVDNTWTMANHSCLDKTQAELLKYEAGFKAALAGERSDVTQSDSWQRGWAEAQE
jgi:hypothetical protein